MLKKPLLIASAAALIATATFSTQAKAGDPIVGALIGGAIGAAIGHDVNGRHGARVGGAIGALAGASIASDYDRGYYDRGYYDGGYYDGGYYDYGPRYSYGPSYGYYAPVVPRATIVYSSGPRYGQRHYRDRDRRDYRGYRSNRWH